MVDTVQRVVCANRDCSHYNQVRTVRMLHLGAGVYARVPLVCECSPKVELTRVVASPSEGGATIRP